MKKKIILASLLTLLLTPVALAHPNKALRCPFTMFYEPPPTHAWITDITFPDGNTYLMIFHADISPNFVGHPTPEGFLFPRHLEKFEETWEIYDDDGVTVLASGIDGGIFSSDTWKFVIEGKVEYATGELEYLAGANMHSRGQAWIDGGVFYGDGVITFTGYARK